MSYLTFNRISATFYQRVFALNETINKSISSNKKIFLSYRRKDIEYVKSVVGFLISQGVTVYIDYLDSLLPDPPDHTTAQILRNRLQNCDKFILLATQNSKDSNWMPWELGLGDGFTGYDNTLVLPLLTEGDYWQEREYYKIYGYIKEGVSNDKLKTDWAVFYPDNEIMWLKDWLNK